VTGTLCVLISASCTCAVECGAMAYACCCTLCVAMLCRRQRVLQPVTRQRDCVRTANNTRSYAIDRCAAVGTGLTHTPLSRTLQHMYRMRISARTVCLSLHMRQVTVTQKIIYASNVNRAQLAAVLLLRGLITRATSWCVLYHGRCWWLRSILLLRAVGTGSATS
jgi:hypothetical protein